VSSVEFKLLHVRPCRYGLMVWPRSDSTIGRALDLYGEFAEGENDVMRRYLCAGNTAVDIGANLGTTALAMAAAVGDTGHVLAFEPQPLIGQCLSTSLTLNERFNVRVVSAAVSAVPGWATMPLLDIRVGGNFGALGLLERDALTSSKEMLRTPLVRLDDHDIDQCHLIKIDVESHEFQVLQGAESTLKRHRPVLYLEAKRRPGTSAYLDYLLKNGWRCYWHFAFFYRLNNFRRNPHNVFGGTGDMNVLAVPHELIQPDDLPEISSADDDWRIVYSNYYRARGTEPL
jgi:FkbM family methyltransferase